MKKNEKIEKLINSSEKNNHRRVITVLVIAVCALLLAAAMIIVGHFTGTLTWFSKTKSSAERDIRVTNFDATAMISVDAGKSYSALNRTFVSKANFDNLRLNINYTGESNAYIRVKLFESFCDQNMVEIVSSPVSYSTVSGWKYNETDGYYYYNQIVKGVKEASDDDTANDTGDETGGDGGYLLNFITGASVSSEEVQYTNTDGFKLVAIIEQVQPDRFEDFFGSNALNSIN